MGISERKPAVMRYAVPVPKTISKVRPARLKRATFCFVGGITRFFEVVKRAASSNSRSPSNLLRKSNAPQEISIARIGA
jgi:hypothetical protein